MNQPIDVAFHFNVAHKVPYLCRLLRKAHHANKRALVCGPADLLTQLDTELWTFEQNEFLAHCRSDAPPGVLARSPVVLAEAWAPHLTSDVLVNCLPEMPQDIAVFGRVIEIVGLLESERAPARDRWRAYLAKGCTLSRHDAMQTASAGEGRA
ncbi:MAG: hypothetical protein RL323_2342 [Pseudomonadota bacterium]|jgi:DNA polymerase-3 subunit chi